MPFNIAMRFAKSITGMLEFAGYMPVSDLQFIQWAGRCWHIHPDIDRPSWHGWFALGGVELRECI